MKVQTTLTTCLALSLGLVACGDGDSADDVLDDEPGIDAGPEVDAAPPDAPPGELLSDLDTDGLIAFCEDVTADPDIAEGLGNISCTFEDCKASPTAVEDCAAKSPPQVIDCNEIVVEDPFADCDRPVAEGEACFAALFGQATLFAAPTCANVGELPALDGIFDPTAHPECDALVEACPEAFD